jgi:hypothetical protein
MALMADRIFTDDCRITAYGKMVANFEQKEAKTFHGLREALPSIPIFEISNVSDYLFEGTDKEEWDVTEDFPNLRPPAPLFWVEHHYPKRIVSSAVGVVELSNPPERLGFLIEARDGAHAQSLASKFVPLGAPVDQARWGMMIVMFSQPSSGVIAGPILTASLILNAEGRAITGPLLGFDLPPELRKELPPEITGATSFLFPTLLALSLLNSNAAVAEPGQVPERLARAYRKRHRRELLPFQRVSLAPVSEAAEQKDGP